MAALLLAGMALVAGIRGATTMTVDIRTTSIVRTDSIMAKDSSRSFSGANSGSNRTQFQQQHAAPPTLPATRSPTPQEGQRLLDQLGIRPR